MLPHSENSKDMFTMLKIRFPHLDLSVIDAHRSFSQNLQNLVGQLGMPPPINSNTQITSMKDAVDKQQLKIQTSLVNQEDILGNITNRASHRNRHGKEQLKSIEEENSQIWQQEHENVGGHDMLSDIWEWGSHHHFKDWFHH